MTELILAGYTYIKVRYFSLNVFFIYIAAENSNCDDSEYSTVNDRIDKIWLNTEIYYSYEACEAPSQDDSKF